VPIKGILCANWTHISAKSPSLTSFKVHPYPIRGKNTITTPLHGIKRSDKQQCTRLMHLFTVLKPRYQLN